MGNNIISQFELIDNRIPKELDVPRWIVWGFGERQQNGKLQKIPKDTRNPELNGKVNNPDCWTSWNNASQLLCKHEGLEGLGFVFVNTDDIMGVDLDDVVNPRTGKIEDWAENIVQLLNSYTELSPSGTGLHIIVRGVKPKGKTRIKYGRGGIEVYETGRYFAYTGNHLSSTPFSIEERSAELQTLYDTFFAPDSPEKKKVEELQRRGDRGHLSDKEVLKKAAQGKNGHIFERLWSGESDGDWSAADLGLCNILAFYCGRDAAQMDRLFRQSGLMRNKWDEVHSTDGLTYGQMTIAKAISDCREVYNPNNSKKGVDPGEICNRRLTELGNAERFVDRHGKNVRYVAKYKKWYIWDGMRWAVDESNRVGKMAVEVVRDIPKEITEDMDENVKTAILKWTARSETAQKLDSMLKIAAYNLSDVTNISPDDFDRDPYVINCKNGTVDLRTGELRPHVREDMISKLAPVEYNPDAICPEWDKFLRTVQPNPEVREYLQRLIGYSMTGLTKEHVVAIFYGEGGNGKGTFIERINKILGDYAYTTPMDTFTIRENGSSNSNDLAAMRGARFVTATEVGDGKKLDEAKVKNMTGGDTVSCRFLYGEYFSYVPQYQIILTVNHKPKIVGQDAGIWRRVHLIPWDYKVESHNINTDLPAILDKELEGIFLWAVQGAVKWFKASKSGKSGLSLPTSIMVATENYKSEMDTLGQFIDECCAIDAESRTKNQTLYQLYKDWCKASGIHAMGKTRWGQLLDNKGIIMRKSGGVRVRVGIRIVQGKIDFPHEADLYSMSIGNRRLPLSESELREEAEKIFQEATSIPKW